MLNYRKCLIVTIFTLIGVIANAQVANINSYSFDNGYIISSNDTIELGTANHLKFFDYIYSNTNYWGKKDRLYSSQKGTYVIEQLLKFDNGKYPVILAFITVDKKKYCIDVVNALESGEIEVKSKFRKGLQGGFILSDITLKKGQPFYEVVIQLDSSYAKSSLYNIAKQAFSKVFNNVDDVIKYKKSKGVIIAKGSIRSHYICSTTPPLTLPCIMSFICKLYIENNNSYRVQIYNIRSSRLYATTTYGIEMYNPVNSLNMIENYKDGIKDNKWCAESYLKNFHKNNTRIISSIRTIMLLLSSHEAIKKY